MIRHADPIWLVQNEMWEYIRDDMDLSALDECMSPNESGSSSEEADETTVTPRQNEGDANGQRSCEIPF